MRRSFGTQLMGMGVIMALVSAPVVAQDMWLDGPEEVQPGIDREWPDVAVDGFGRSIVVWAAFNGPGGDRNDIWMRRFDPAGNPLAEPVMVNTLVDDDQRYPRVVARADGSFFVLWQSDEVDAGDTYVWIRGQAFNADADPVGSEVLVSQLSTGQVVDSRADLALGGDGYVAAWDSYNSTGNDNSGSQSIQGRRLSVTGQALGNQFQCNNTADGRQFESAVTGLADGGFLVIWRGPSNGSDPDNHSIQGRRYSSTGAPVGGDFQINTTVAGSQAEPAAATDEGGRVAVVWESPTASNQATEIFVRLYDSNLQPVGQDRQVNILEPDYQLDPRVGAAAPDHFMIIWTSETSSGGDVDRSVQARMVRTNGQFTGPQFQVNSHTLQAQENPSVGGSYGRLMAAWDSQSYPGVSNDDVIAGDMYETCIFCDDFEVGDTWRWSSETP